MSPPVGAIVKSWSAWLGSITHCPVLPLLAVVSTRMPLRSTACPDVSTKPPFPAAPPPRALSVPLTVTSPPSPPSSLMLPPSATALSALITPDMLMTLRTASLTVAASNRTLPPLAVMVPLLSISAPLPVISAVGTATWRKLPPLRSSAMRSPDPIPILPSGTMIVPLLDTAPPSNAIKAFSPARMVPALVTTADDPLPANARFPPMKSPSAMSRVEATKPPRVSTAPLAVMAMPLGLTR